MASIQSEKRSRLWLGIYENKKKGNFVMDYPHRMTNSAGCAILCLQQIIINLIIELAIRKQYSLACRLKRVPVMYAKWIGKKAHWQKCTCIITTGHLILKLGLLMRSFEQCSRLESHSHHCVSISYMKSLYSHCPAVLQTTSLLADRLADFLFSCKVVHVYNTK